MIISTRKSKVQAVFLTLIFILGLSGISWGAEFWLRAETLTKTMPDASVITMWGFAQCTDGTYANCTAATVPGPRLTVPAGDTVLTINLRNNLTGLFVEPVSIVIPGLAPATAMTPVKFTDPASRQRVRSFTTETPADNFTTVTYSWTMKPGTYLYESGTHPAVQVQMGLYGAVTNDAAAGQAYGLSTSYAAEAVLLFSEIDPVLHGHVAAGTYGTPPPAGITSTVDYEPRYFLINGEPFTPAALHIPAGTYGQNLLLRFLSAGLKQRVPTIYGMNVSLVAEDGNLYPYPKEQYSLLLSPGKTKDALVIGTLGGEYPVYDRRLGLTNDTASSGGMLTYLSVGPDLTPPTGSVVINGNAATTNSWNVTLTLNATDPVNAVTNMQFSWDNITWLGWEPYATTRNISIPAGPDGTKTIYVQFRDAVGNVSLTYQDSISYVTTPPLATPTNMAAVINSGPLRISLSWRDASNNETSFAIWRSDNGGAFTQIGTVARTATGSISTGGTLSFINYNTVAAPLVAGHTYSYYVTAVNAGGTSAPSNTAVVNFSAPSTAPSGLTGSSVMISSTLDRITLNWTDNTNNEANFQIQRATNSSFTNVTTYLVGANVTTYVQSVSRTLPTLYYRVRATNGLGNSGWSNTVTVLTP